MTDLPHWDLSNIYPDLESGEFIAALDQFKDQISDTKQWFSAGIVNADAHTGRPQEAAALATLIGESVDRLNSLYALARTLHTYIFSCFSTDSRNALAARRLSEFGKIGVDLQTLEMRWQSWVGRLGPVLEQALLLDPTAQAHAFILNETAEQAKYLMSEAEEGLAAELNLSGATAWSKLQRTVTSQLTLDFELDGRVQKLSMPALINLHSHPDEAVRRRAYYAENQAWDAAGPR